MWPRVELHEPKLLILNFPTPKMLIIQLPASNVWKNSIHTTFIQFQNTIEKSFNLVSPAIWTQYNNLVMKNNYLYYFLKRNVYPTISICEKRLFLTILYEKNVNPTISIYKKTLILEILKQFSESMKL